MITFRAIPTYKKFIIFIFPFFLFLLLQLHAYNYSIVFVHIGKTLPNYLPTALEQARLFNKNADIILIANQEAIKKTPYNFSRYTISIVTCESLQKTQEHLYFLRHSTLNRSFREGFWLHATERFYYLHEFMEQYQKKHVFHLESDNMLYANLQKILPVFTTHYTEKIGATFDNDARCIPGFMYISGVGVLYDLISFMLQKTESAYNDMRIISLFKNEFPEHIKQLPITCKQYAKDRQLKSKKNHCTKNPKHYYQHYDEFEGIFDAAALGQYLGGQDPRNGPCQPGFINESCLFDPSHFSFIWQKDRHERNVPYLVYKNKKYKIINLHIHSKKLALYSSL